MSKEVATMAGADAMRERIAAHPWPRGGVEVLRANRGYTLYSRRTGGPVARLRPTGKEDNVQVLWWRREAWATPGDFGLLTLPLGGPRLRCDRGLLLDQRLTLTASENVQSRTKSPAEKKSNDSKGLQSSPSAASRDSKAD